MALHRHGSETQYFERLVVTYNWAHHSRLRRRFILVPRDETFRDNKVKEALMDAENREHYKALSKPTSS